MLHTVQAGRQDQCGWADRSEHWLKLSERSQPRRRKRERRSHPLILSGHGSSLRVDKGTLIVRDGFTHFPQSKSEYRFFRGDLEVPERIILIDGSGTLSFAVLDWLREQEASLVRITWDGKGTIAVGGEGSPTNSDKLKWQIETRSSADQQLAFGCALLSEKLVAMRDVLSEQFDDTPKRDAAFTRIETALKALAARKVATVNDMLGIEGMSASDYFSCWQGLQLNWKAESKFPVPPRFGGPMTNDHLF